MTVFCSTARGNVMRKSRLLKVMVYGEFVIFIQTKEKLFHTHISFNLIKYR